MRDNKILAAAIASVVSLGGGAALLSASDAFAGITYREPNGGTVAEFATQLFPGASIATTATGHVSGCSDNHSFLMEYKIDIPTTSKDLKINNIIKVKATLDEGAVWAVGINPSLHATVCAAPYSSGIIAGSCTTGDVITASIAKSSVVGGANTSSVEFAIQMTADMTAGSAQASFYLYFCPDINADFLQEPDKSLNLTMEAFQDVTIEATGGFQTVQIGSTDKKVIAKSKSGLQVDIKEAIEPAKAAISFAEDGLKFSTGATASTMVSTDRVNLGSIQISPAGGVKDRDGSSPFSLGTGWSGKLTITDGVFSASTTPGANQVFLSTNEGCTYDPTTSIPASSVKSTVAEWASLTDLTNLTKPNMMYVCVVADGVKAIEEQPKAPTALLEIGKGSAIGKYPGRLRHIRENATKCTLFNIPDGTETLSPSLSTDVVSVRITNNTAQEGTLYGTLYDQSGKPLYTPKRQVLGPIGPFETIRYYTGQEGQDGYDPSFDLTKFGNAQHWVGQRATLEIATELSDISAFGLVRSRSSGPGPNINMSTGATGNGCD